MKNCRRSCFALVKLSFIFLFLGVCFTSFGQNITVSGVITDATNREAVIGASIQLKGSTTVYSISDIDGRYSIDVPSDGILVITSMGYEVLEVEVASRTQIDILLQSDTQILDDVIVVAFGTATKRSFTGSASVLKSEDLSKRLSTDVSNALVGTTPGLQIRGSSGEPGALSGAVSIRGISSLYADTDPLIILDGAPFTSPLNNIPQEDIESITVLKDASSASLYGSRGAAGVILITTKSGKSKEPSFNVDIKMGVNSRAIQEYNVIKDPGDYYEAVYNQYFNYYHYEQSQPLELANFNANDIMIKQLGYNIYNLRTGEQLIGLDGLLNPYATLGHTYVANGETYYQINDDWTKAAYHNAMRKEYNFSVNGAMDKGSYYSSISYIDDDGIIANSMYKRLSARLKADYQAKDWLKFGANVAYTNSTTTSPLDISTGHSSASLMFFTSRMAPIYPLYVRVLDENGNPVIVTDHYGNPKYDYGISSTNYPGSTRGFMIGNPIGENDNTDISYVTTKLVGTFSVDVDITDYLKFNATSTVDWGYTTYSNSQSSIYGPKASVNGEITKEHSNTYRQNHLQTLKFFKQIGNHNINVMLGHEYYYKKSNYLSAIAQGLFTPEIPEINAAANNALFSASDNSTYNVEGYFSNIQYNYKDKYFASASFRRDASSRFDKKHRWGNFWSVGGAWIVNKEDFFNVRWIDDLKLKASIGEQGNDNIESFAYVDIYTLNPASSTTMSPSFERMGNPDITWETTINTNIGVELSMLNNRLSATIDFYNKKTTDLIFWISIPESAGSNGYYGNIGDIRNTGVEIALQGSIIKSDNVEWNMYGNASTNKSVILSLPESKTNQNGGFVEDGNWYRVGGAIINPFLAEYAGVNENGEATYYIDTDLNGVVNRPGKKRDGVTTIGSEASRYEQGDTYPKLFGGFGTSLSLYGFDLSLTFDYQIGGKVLDLQYAGLMDNITSDNGVGEAIHVDALKAWSPTNRESNIPRMYYGDQFTSTRSDRWFTNASYLNFQSAAIGYSLPKKLIDNLRINNLRVYLSGENLTFFSARRGFDPRYSFTETADINVYSPVRTIMGGIQITF